MSIFLQKKLFFTDKGGFFDFLAWILNIPDEIRKGDEMESKKQIPDFCLGCNLIKSCGGVFWICDDCGGCILDGDECANDECESFGLMVCGCHIHAEPIQEFKGRREIFSA